MFAETAFVPVYSLFIDKEYIKWIWKLYKELSKDPEFSFINFIKAIYLLKYEKIMKHEGKYIFSSFIPPILSKAFDNVFGNAIRKDHPYTEFAHASRRGPISVHISVTNRCMYNCWHCCNKNKKQTDDLSTCEMIKLIRDVQDMGISIIGFTGGEPLLRKDLLDIIRAVDERSISLLLTTGDGLTLMKAKELKKAGLFATIISIDSASEEIHDKKRGYSGAFKIAKRAINNSRKAGLYTIIATVATNENVNDGDLLKIFELGKKLGVHEIRAGEMIPTGRLIHSSPEELLGKEERKKLIKIHKKLNKKRDYPKISMFSHIESGNVFGCTAGIFHSYIDAEGNLCPCDFVPISFGNVREQSVSELWQQMRKKIRYPKRRCFAIENHHIIEEAFEDKLPVGNIIMNKIVKTQWFHEKPDFFRFLLGEI